MDIPAGDGKLVNLFLRCMSIYFVNIVIQCVSPCTYTRTVLIPVCLFQVMHNSANVSKNDLVSPLFCVFRYFLNNIVNEGKAYKY